MGAAKEERGRHMLAEVHEAPTTARRMFRTNLLRDSDLHSPWLETNDQSGVFGQGVAWGPAASFAPAPGIP